MKTTTEDITLSLGLDDATLSPECTSTLIDLWLELQMTAVESVQAPTPNLFAFAETCFFFAVISENNKPEGARHANDPEVQRVQMQIDEEDFERVRRRSVLEAHAQPRDGASSSAIPTEGAVRFASERFVTAGAILRRLTHSILKIDRRLILMPWTPPLKNTSARIWILTTIAQPLDITPILGPTQLLGM